MKGRLAIVVQRCGEGIVGGSEALAWQWATLLSDTYAVDLLTTTAVDAVSWENALHAGTETHDGVTVRRFSVDIGRTAYWHDLHKLLLHSVEEDSRSVAEGRRWTTAWQEEFIRKQGPYSSDLMRYLHVSGMQYEAVIFVTYLFPTTYFGFQQVEGVPRILVPTVHDEAPAYLPVYRRMAAEADLVLWNTAAEQRWGEQLWGTVSGRIVGMAVETGIRTGSAEVRVPYLLYCGRIDQHKGCDELLAFYGRFCREHPDVVRLVLTGHDETKHSFGDGVDYRGYVSDEEKWRLMRGAMLFCMPSPHESFSISSLEAMAQSTPILVTAASDVLQEHVESSRGGMTYHDYDEFERSVLMAVRRPDLRDEAGTRARTYVMERYSQSAIKEKLRQAVASVVSTGQGLP